MKEINAIVLAAGSGRRMGADVPKQYLPLAGKPVMVHSLETFEKSPVKGIVLVVAPGEVEYCRREIVEKYHISKVISIVEGGEERYDSVYRGLLAAKSDYVLIHDCARAFLTQNIISRAIDSVIAYKACVVGMPVKDTIKISDRDGYVSDTPDRSLMWSVQTPQCFAYDVILEAYEKLQHTDKTGVTDDAMVVEQMLHVPVKLIEGSYDNIKVTTPEDLVLGEQILSNSKNIIKRIDSFT